MVRRHARTGYLACLLLLFAAVGTACGSSGPQTTATSGSQTAAASAGVSGGSVSALQAQLQKYYNGSDGTLPASGPKAVPGKSVWIITCGQAFAGCATPGNAAAAAVKAIGWKATIVDGKLTPSVYVAGVNAAIAAHASAIMLVSVDCGFVQAPLEKARAAGIKIIGLLSFDCTAQGGPKIFDADPMIQGFPQFESQSTKAIATWIRVKTSDQPVALLVNEDDDLAAKYNVAEIGQDLAACSTCKTYTLNITGEDLLNGSIATMVDSALAQHPDVNVVVAPYDASITLGIGQAVKASGRHLLLTGVEGLQANIAEIKAGGPDDLAAATPDGWLGWAAVDEANRLFAGLSPVNEGLGFQLIDHDHNIPADGIYDGNVNSAGQPKQDYEAVYRKIWGVS